jgi:hypothetical protein
MLDTDANGFAAREGPGLKWLIGDYEAGDAVFHHTCEWTRDTRTRIHQLARHAPEPSLSFLGVPARPHLRLVVFSSADALAHER